MNVWKCQSHIQLTSLLNQAMCWIEPKLHSRPTDGLVVFSKPGLVNGAEKESSRNLDFLIGFWPRYTIHVHLETCRIWPTLWLNLFWIIFKHNLLYFHIWWMNFLRPNLLNELSPRAVAQVPTYYYTFVLETPQNRPLNCQGIYSWIDEFHVSISSRLYESPGSFKIIPKSK